MATVRHNGMTQVGFCPGCGTQLWSQWGACPRCGRSLKELEIALWQRPAGATAPPRTIRSEQAEEALGLLRAGLVADAEARLRAGLAEAPADVELHPIPAGLRLQRYAVQEAGALVAGGLMLVSDGSGEQRPAISGRQTLTPSSQGLPGGG